MYHNNARVFADFSNTNHLPYTHKLTVTALGGEAVIGKVPRKVAEYWNGFDRDNLSYLLIDQKRNISRTLGGRLIDPIFTTKRWNDVCDVVELHGPALDWDPYFAVVDRNETVLFENLTADQLELDLIVDGSIDLSEGSSYFAGRSGDVITSTFYIDTVDEFDLKLLKVKFSWFLNIRLLDHVIYDGKQIHDVDICSHRYEKPMAGIIVDF